MPSTFFIHIHYGEWDTDIHGEGPPTGTVGAFVRAPSYLWQAAAIPIRTYMIIAVDDIFFVDVNDVAQVVAGLRGTMHKAQMCDMCLGKKPEGREPCFPFTRIYKASQRPRSSTYYSSEAGYADQERRWAEERDRVKREREAEAERLRKAAEAEAQDIKERAAREKAEREERDRRYASGAPPPQPDDYHSYWRYEDPEAEVRRHQERKQREAEEAARKRENEERERRAEEARKRAQESDYRRQRTYGGGPYSEDDIRRVWEDLFGKYGAPGGYGFNYDDFFGRGRDAGRQRTEERTRSEAPPPRARPGTMTRDRAAAILKISIYTSKSDAKAARTKLAMENHPDRGGTTEAMAEINAAYDVFIRGM